MVALVKKHLKYSRNGYQEEKNQITHAFTSDCCYCKHKQSEKDCPLSAAHCLT